MRKVLCLILCVGLLALGSTAIADDQPIITIHGTDTDIQVYKIFDLRTGLICYVSSAGGISCTYRGKLLQTDDIKREVRKYKERKDKPPHVILLNQSNIKKLQ